jgi:hypothetical protein
VRRDPFFTSGQIVRGSPGRVQAGGRTSQWPLFGVALCIPDALFSVCRCTMNEPEENPIARFSIRSLSRLGKFA